MPNSAFAGSRFVSLARSVRLNRLLIGALLVGPPGSLHEPATAQPLPVAGMVKDLQGILRPTAPRIAATRRD